MEVKAPHAAAKRRRVGTVAKESEFVAAAAETCSVTQGRSLGRDLQWPGLLSPACRRVRWEGPVFGVWRRRSENMGARSSECVLYLAGLGQGTWDR